MVRKGDEREEGSKRLKTVKKAKQNKDMMDGVEVTAKWHYRRPKSGGSDRRGGEITTTGVLFEHSNCSATPGEAKGGNPLITSTGSTTGYLMSGN